MLLTLLCASVGQGADWQGSLAASSDNVYRGISLSDGQLSFLADVHLSLMHWFFGVAADTVRLAPRDSTAAQVIGYLGYQQPLGADFSVALGARHYDYPGEAYRTRYNYNEFDATLDWRDRLSLRLIGSPDTYQVGYERHGTGSALAAELSAREPLPRAFTAALGVGYYDLQRVIGTGYFYWSAGLWKQWDAWNFSVSYIGTDETARRVFGSRAGQRAVISILWSY